MFTGVINAELRLVIASYIPKFPEQVNVICSGNFTTETTLRLNGYEGRITSCDVSLYTCALGACFTNQSLPVDVNVEEFPDFEVLQDFMDTPERRAAAVTVALDALEFAEQKNPYQQRTYQSYIRRLRDLCEKTVAKVEDRKAKLKLDEFHAKDAWERIEEISPDELIMVYPPTYAGGYEKIYKAIEALFIWTPPVYGEMVSGSELTRKITSQKGVWLLVNDERNIEHEELTGPPVAQVAQGGRRNVYLYTNLDVRTKVIRRKLNIASEPKWPRLSDQDEITEESVLTIHEVKSPEANYLRQLYSSVKPNQSNCPYNFVICIDGKLAGIALFAMATRRITFDGTTVDSSQIIYMMADLPVASHKHGRLSKLIVMAATSDEMKGIVDRRGVQDTRYCLTTAFSDHPVSMKYRGWYKLHSRTQQTDGTYQLNYYASMGEKTLQEIFEIWHRKHYKVMTMT